MATTVMRSMLLALALFAVVPALAQEARAQDAKQSKKKAAPEKQAAIVIDANSGKVLHASSADEPRFPASLTKMMTLYMVFEEIERGRLTFQSRVRFSERAVGMAPSKLGLKVGEEITVLDAVKVLVVKSANDVAVAVAEHIGGTEYQFARMMTERANQIGMRSTTFRNASGLPNPDQRSTARDMATLGMRLQDDFPQHYHLFSTASFTYGGKTYRTHNTLMLGFPGMDGIKTGYTRASGFNLVSSVRANGKHVVGAVFGGKTAATRNAHMRSLLFTALAKASTQRTRQQGSALVAEARPQKAPARAETARPPKTAMPPPARKPATIVAANAPPPAAPATAHDAIAEVLAEGDESTFAEATSSAAVLPPPRLDLEALRAAMSETEAEAEQQTETVTASNAAPQDINGLIRDSVVDGASDNRSAPTVRTLSDAGAAAPSVRQPSTLAAQATMLAGLTTPAQAARPKPPVPQFQPAPTGAGYAIQIGAYLSPEDAQAKLNTVRSRAAGLLEGHHDITIPVHRDNRLIYRARFVSFDEGGASNACLELRRLAIDCFVMKAD
ncbi:serine hydrolase [Hyphomicrobium sp. CS1GBMeth3]|uniref:serine hydrolase n=1 Tax=Hyphomicrobium sp. CS1GBMeth3 TaxID=1892845 RepID=UPI0015C55F3C|nr:serine hydrolase [Hyphomicrobium sp. CS1GBMeth3]